MKAIIFIIIFFLSIQLFSQNKVSYKIDSFYYEKEKIEIPSLKCEIIDKKSLREAKAKGYKENPDLAFEVYYTLDLNIDFFELAKKIKISKDSTIYLLHIQPIDMSYFRIGYIIDIPKNILITQLSANDKPFKKSGYVRSYKLGESFNGYLQYDVFSGDFILKVIQIGKVHEKFSINIHHIDCHLANNENKFNNKLSDVGMLENGCGNSVTCMPEAEDWVNEYKGVFRIFIDNIQNKEDGFKYGYLATGFVLNTVGNYDMDKSSKPYALTCFHILEEVIKNGYDIDEVLASKDDLNAHTMVKFNYLRRTCGDAINNPPWQYPEFVIKEKGDWVKRGDHDEDYLFLQFGSDDNGTIQKLIYNFDINSYPGWRHDLKTNYDYSKFAPTYIFHHDSSDYPDYEMKYAKDNEYAVTDQSGKFIQLHIDEGFETSGASGSPIFGSDHNVIGMLIAGQNTCENPYLQGTKGIAFSYLWDKANLANYLGDAEKVYTLNTTWDNLPAHCDNCEYDFDKGETGLDCGGPCKPCKVFLGEDVDINTFKSTNLPEVVQADNISVSGTSANPVTINKNLLLNAKNSITLNKDINIGNNLELKTGRISIVVSREEDVLCNLQYGNYLYWGQTYTISVKNATKFSFILSSATQDVYSNSGDIYYDGIIDVWDSNLGDHVNRNESMVLFFILKLWDTVGGYHQVRGNVTMFPS